MIRIVAFALQHIDRASFLIYTINVAIALFNATGNATRQLITQLLGLEVTNGVGPGLDDFQLDFPDGIKFGGAVLLFPRLQVALG